MGGWSEDWRVMLNSTQDQIELKLKFELSFAIFLFCGKGPVNHPTGNPPLNLNSWLIHGQQIPSKDLNTGFHHELNFAPEFF